MFNLYLSWIRNNISVINPDKTGIYWGVAGNTYLKFKDTDILQYWGSAQDIQKFAS